MKIVKKILIGIVGLVALLLIVALFVKGEYSVVKEVTINKPKQDVFNYIKILRNQDHFSVWNMKDPNAKMETKGTDGTVGAISSWDSDNKEVGKGEQEIKKIVDGERVDMELRFKKPFEATDQAFFTTETEGTGTKVKWGFNGKMPYPMNLMCLFMDMEKMLGPDLQKGLDNLKVELEK
ncbi:MAG: SRPBCC family protein [Bacteroidetes bacterium]|nr:SRPBCC family protein [Bacteroidota bacterium]